MGVKAGRCPPTARVSAAFPGSSLATPAVWSPARSALNLLLAFARELGPIGSLLLQTTGVTFSTLSRLSCHSRPHVAAPRCPHAFCPSEMLFRLAGAAPLSLSKPDPRTASSAEPLREPARPWTARCPRARLLEGQTDATRGRPCHLVPRLALEARGPLFGR